MDFFSDQYDEPDPMLEQLEPVEKGWVDYRFEEMEEKAGVTALPKYDMDGLRFDPDGFESDERDDAYVWSISKRLEMFALYTMDPV